MDNKRTNTHHSTSKKKRKSKSSIFNRSQESDGKSYKITDFFVSKVQNNLELRSPPLASALSPLQFQIQASSSVSESRGQYKKCESPRKSITIVEKGKEKRKTLTTMKHVKKSIYQSPHEDKLSDTLGMRSSKRISKKPKHFSDFISSDNIRNRSRKPQAVTSPRKKLESSKYENNSKCSGVTRNNGNQLISSCRSKSSVANVKRKVLFNNKNVMGKENHSQKKSDEEASESFKKYGVVLPSYKEILKEIDHCKKYHEMITSISDLVVPLPDTECEVSEESDHEKDLLDCKHLSIDLVVSAFTDNIEYLDNIKSGATYCKRHELYERPKTRKCLIYNTSMILFTNTQKQTLASLLCERYGNDSATTDYYFKVLLPELCLKIFAKENSMTYDEASKYLCYDELGYT